MFQQMAQTFLQQTQKRLELLGITDVKLSGIYYVDFKWNGTPMRLTHEQVKAFVNQFYKGA